MGGIKAEKPAARKKGLNGEMMEITINGKAF